jgi:hypothetical protein
LLDRGGTVHSGNPAANEINTGSGFIFEKACVEGALQALRVPWQNGIVF